MAERTKVELEVCTEDSIGEESYSISQRALPFASVSRIDCQESPYKKEYDSGHYFVRIGQKGRFRQLRDWVSDCEGMVLVTGMAGTGKTTLLNELNLDLQAAGSLPIFFPNPIPTPDALLDACLEQAGPPHTPATTPEEKLQLLADTLARTDTELTTVLLVDEAHILPDDVLRTLLELSAPGPQDRSVLPVVLAGDPLLARRLADTRFLPLAKSIRYHYPLTPLSEDEVEPFIQYRIHAANDTATNPFSTEAVERVAHYSGGLPAKIKQLGDMALFIAEFESKRQITRNIVDQAANHVLMADKPPAPPRHIHSNRLPARTLEQQELTIDDIAQATAQTVHLPSPENPQKKLHSYPEAILDLQTKEKLKAPAEVHSNDRMPLGALHHQLEPIAGRVLTASQERVARSRRLHQAVVTFVLVVVVLTTAWLATSYQIWLDQQQPLLSKSPGFFQFTRDRFDRLTTNIISATDVGAKPTPGIDDSSTGGSNSASESVANGSMQVVKAWTPDTAPVSLVTRFSERAMVESKRPPLIFKTTNQISPQLSSNAAELSPPPPPGGIQFDRESATTAKIPLMLAIARKHVQADRLMAPRFDNALAVYQKILRADPGNTDALTGIETIKTKLMNFAHDALAQGEIDSARGQINKVLWIDAEDKTARDALASLRLAIPLTKLVKSEE